MLPLLEAVGYDRFDIQTKVPVTFVQAQSADVHLKLILSLTREPCTIVTRPYWWLRSKPQAHR